jgi:hypothetical protein
MSRGKSMTECLMEEALWVGAGAAAGLVMNPVTAAVTVAAIRMGLPGAIKGWLDATRNASNAEQTANITQLGAGVPKNLGVDELLERKARIEASLTAIDKKLAKASDPLAEKLRQDIEALEPDFRNAQVHCQAIQDAENDLASEKALAQRNRNSFIGFLNGAKGIAASCKTAAEAADLSRRITEVRQTLTALAKAVDRAKKVHFDLKLAAAKLNGLKSVIDDKQKLLEANERELKARGDALGEAQTEFAALRPEIANYYQAVDAALENIAKQLSVFPSPLPAGTPPAIVSSINKLRQVNQSTFRLPGGDLPEIASAKNRQFQSAKENLEKWTAIQAQMKAKLALYLRMLPCAQQISKALPGYADPRLAEIEAASSNSAAEDQLANLDAALAKCRGVSDCDTGFREAEDAIQLLDLDRARNKVQDLQRKNCQSAIAQALRGATEAKTNYENGTGTAMATCDFDGAIRLAQAIYQGYPRSPYAQAANASIVKLEGWKAAKARIQLLLQQAKTARDWPTSTIYLAEANGLALLPCLQDMVRKAEPDIQAAQLNKPKPTTATNPQDPNNNNNSQNTAKAGLGGSTGTVQDPQKPPARTTPGQQNNPLNPNNPPQNPNTPVAMHPCEGGFHAEPNTGFTGEQGRFNVQLAGADLAPVQEVAIRTRGADRILMTRLAQGRFTYTFRFQGIAGTIPITFVGKDRNGNDFCEHTIQVTSKGPR